MSALTIMVDVHTAPAFVAAAMIRIIISRSFGGALM